MRPDEDDPAHDGSMGRPLPGIETRVVDGELQVRPATVPTFFSHYLGEEPFDGEWWPTGDHVREDEDGYLWFEGRDDDIIITAGYRVGPFEVESALVSHPAVAEAAAVPAPDEERGSVVRAIVVLANGHPSEQLAAELQEHVKRVTAPYKYPRIVEFTDELPKTPTGKIRRAQLRTADEQWRLGLARGLGRLRGIFIVTNLGLLAVGATLAVLPHYVKDNLNGSDLEVGIVSGAFAFTGSSAGRSPAISPTRRGRKPTVIVGALLAAIAGSSTSSRPGSSGLIVARFFLGAGEGTVFTAGSAWNVDMAPEERRGRMIGLYGLAIWTGLTLGPPIGVLLQNAGGFHLVWAFAAGAPLLGARSPYSCRRTTSHRERRPRSFHLTRGARPGRHLRLSVFGFAAVSAFIVLSLDERGIGHGPAVFSVFAATVVATRLLAGGLPDRIGAARCAVGAALIEAVGLISRRRGR